jgi:hypothetical protein
MITAIVQFKLPKPVSPEKAHELFLQSAPRYRKVYGLIRKYYILSEEGTVSGGVYLFKSREYAQKLYTDEWKQYIIKKYGGEPSFIYFDVPVVVDNLTEKVIEDR